MKAKVLMNFVDRVESEIQNKEVLRTVGDVFTVTKTRFDEIKRAGDFVEEVKETPKPKK
jgi:Ni,Fe-hydrogenase III large subunit